jgi:beta-glucosidase
VIECLKGASAGVLAFKAAGGLHAADDADVPQLYLTAAAGDARPRLLGFERVALGPGESRRITVTADPRLLARFDGGAGRWRLAAGAYRVALARAADDVDLTAEVALAERLLGS